MPALQENSGRLVGLFVGCVLYGFLLSTFFPCIHSLLFFPGDKFQLKLRSDIKYPVVAATILMFIISTFSAAVSLQDVLAGFIYYDGPGGSLEYYNTLKGWSHWMLAVDDSLQVILGDGLLIYRCYALYSKSWRAIVVPAAMWVALIGFSINSSYREVILPEGKQLTDSSVLPSLTATLLLTLLTSVVTTYLIIRRLLRADRADSGNSITIKPHVLSRVATIFLETGLVYTLSVITSLIVYLWGGHLHYAAALGMIHVVPITCNLLLMRVGGINRVQPLVHVSLASPGSKLVEEV